ncbi:hypothetical protein OPT61_g3059 [Boeremia exigua]|uniref:Uncharacterized protein n=1 Tax=Boeremia exigua TaxID=749465 RepID=A0ACC2IJ83_9PLEO|nr:hypothetical protein OPT61_g3059 [Boeremia exigua]
MQGRVLVVPCVTLTPLSCKDCVPLHKNTLYKLELYVLAAVTLRVSSKNSAKRGAVRRQIVKRFSQFKTIALSAVESPDEPAQLIEELGDLLDGAQCKTCSWITINKDEMRKHCKKYHQQAWVGEKSSLYKTVKVQSFFHTRGLQKYFIVNLDVVEILQNNKLEIRVQAHLAEYKLTQQEIKEELQTLEAAAKIDKTERKAERDRRAAVGATAEPRESGCVRKLCSKCTAGPQHLRRGRAGDDSSLLSQVAVTVGQAKDCAALLAAAARAGNSSVLSLRTAVPRVSNAAGAGQQLQQLRVAQRAGRVGHQPAHKGAEARDREEAGRSAAHARDDVGETEEAEVDNNGEDVLKLQNLRTTAIGRSVALLLRGRWERSEACRAEQDDEAPDKQQHVVRAAAGARQARRWLSISRAGAGFARSAGEADTAYRRASDRRRQELAVYAAGLRGGAGVRRIQQCGVKCIEWKHGKNNLASVVVVSADVAGNMKSTGNFLGVYGEALAGESAGDEELAASWQPDGDADSNAAAAARGRA